MTTQPRVKFTELVYASVALAFLVGAVLVFTQRALNVAHLSGAALVIMVLCYYILRPRKLRRAKKPAWVPEAEAGTVPRYGSRRWARANFHSGIISIEELNQFYISHPEDMSDPDR